MAAGWRSGPFWWLMGLFGKPQAAPVGLPVCATVVTQGRVQATAVTIGRVQATVTTRSC